MPSANSNPGSIKVDRVSRHVVFADVVAGPVGDVNISSRDGNAEWLIQTGGDEERRDLVPRGVILADDVVGAGQIDIGAGDGNALQAGLPGDQVWADGVPVMSYSPTVPVPVLRTYKSCPDTAMPMGLFNR